MLRTLLDSRLHQVFAGLTFGTRSTKRRPRAARFPRIETLEDRALLTNAVGAAIDGFSGSAVMAAAIPAVLESISITPANPSIPIGEVQPFSAIGTYSNNATQDLSSQVTWASSNTAAATISNTFPQGVATGLTAGASTITATLDGITGTTQLTVTPVILEMIMLTPLNTSVQAGGTVQYMAMGMYSDESTTDFTNQVTWASSVPSAASVSNAAGFDGPGHRSGRWHNHHQQLRWTV